MTDTVTVAWEWHDEAEWSDERDDYTGYPLPAGPDAENDPDARCDLRPCTNPIGWILHEDDEYPARSGLVWRSFLAIIRPGDERPARFCEDCAIWLLDVTGKEVERP